MNCFSLANPTSTVTVSSSTALRNAVNAAAPGKHILVAPGTYTGGTITLNRAGTEANPIVVRPAGARGSVTFKGADWTIADTASYLTLTNLYFNNDSRVKMSGDHNRISRCRWRGMAGARPVSFLTSRDGRVDHCDFGGPIVENDTRKHCIQVDPNGFDNGTNVRNLIDYCHFHDIVQTAELPNGQETIRTYAQWNNLALGPAGSILTVDHCRFSNMAQPVEVEQISIKSGGWKVSFCTFIDTKFMSQFRSADNGEIRSCWFERTHDPCFNIFGRNHLYIGNTHRDGLDVRVACGSSTTERLIAARDISPVARSHNCQVIGNLFQSGRLIVGGFWSSPSDCFFPALDNNLFGNVREAGGTAHTFDTRPLTNGGPRHTGTTFADPGTDPRYAYAPAVRLEAADVGLAAPDPLCPSGPQS